jgi:hypothetical protein
MKKGKTLKINGYQNCKVLYGTVDSKKLKSIYINLQTWAEPKTEIEKTTRIVSLLNRDIKQTISNKISLNSFKENFIVDLDLRSSGISLGKKSFLNLEVTLFLNEGFEFKCELLKKEVNEIVKSLYNNNIVNNSYFKFKKTKKDNKIQLM